VSKKQQQQQFKSDLIRDASALQFRTAEMTAIRVEGGENSVIRMSVSSETPVLTYINMGDQWMWAYEILDHKESSIDRSRCADGLVIQDTHYGDQIGLIRAPMIADGKLGGDIEFCTGERATEIAADAAKGLRRNVSVGYRCDPAKYVQEGIKDGVPVVRSLRWCPHEASFVNVPADPGVGVGRSLNNETIPAQTGERGKMPTEKTPPTADQVVEIYRLARAFNMEPGQADDHIRAGGTVEEFRALTLKKAEDDNAKRAEDAVKLKKGEPAGKRNDLQIVTPELQKEIEKRFSVLNVMRHMDAARKGERSVVDIGFELEVSQEVEKISGRKAQGIYIPHSVPVFTGKRADPFLKGANGANFVSTNLLIGQLIDALRSRMVLSAAGATTLSGLVGDVAIPKGGAITGGWVDGENGAGTEGKPTVSQVTGTPKTASGWTDISRRLMLQSSIDVEAFVQGELMNTIARLIEVAAFAGTNANGQPKGLKDWSGVNTPTLTANVPTRAQLLAFIENIMTDNAEFPNQSWIMRPNGWALLKNIADGIIKNVAGTENVAGFGSGAILKDDGMMLGFSSHVTTNIPNHSLWFGAWQQLVIGLWSGVDLTIDPYSNSTTGAVRVVALQDADIMVRHGEAFSYGSTLTA
jgi:HK97 family phage major capsid protein